MGEFVRLEVSDGVGHLLEIGRRDAERCGHPEGVTEAGGVVDGRPQRTCVVVDRDDLPDPVQLGEQVGGRLVAAIPGRDLLGGERAQPSQQVDDVLGGDDMWKHADSTAGTVALPWCDAAEITDHWNSDLSEM